MKHRKTVYSVIVMAIFMMIFANISFAETTAADLRAKMAAANDAGVVTLADLQAKLKGAKAQKEMIRINGIAKRFGTNDLHALRLTNGTDGDTIGEIAEVVSPTGLRNIRKIVENNGLTMQDCKTLPPGFVFFIPSKMIAKELRLNAFEVAKLRRALESEREANVALTDQVGSLSRTLTQRDELIDTLTGRLAAERNAHATTRDLLAQEKSNHAATVTALEGEQQAHATTKQLLVEEQAAYTALNETYAAEVEAHRATKGLLKQETGAHAATVASLETAQGNLKKSGQTVAIQGEKITTLEATIKKLEGTIVTLQEKLKSVGIQLEKTTIAAIAFAAVLALLLIGIFVRFLYKRSKKANAVENEASTEAAEMTADSEDLVQDRHADTEGDKVGSEKATIHQIPSAAGATG